ITTGTGGGIGPNVIVGDVIVSRFLTFDCQRHFKMFDGNSYSCPTKVSTHKYRTAKRLFAANEHQMPATNQRPPMIITARSKTTGIATTDFFGFDTSDDHYQLQRDGALSEMGDAVLGRVC